MPTTKFISKPNVRPNLAVFLILLFLFIFLVVKATNQPLFWADEGMWNYIGWLWSNGIPPYAGAFENKSPGIFYLYLFSNYFFGTTPYFVRILAAAALSLTGYLVFDLGKRFFGLLAGAISILFYSYLVLSNSCGFELSKTEPFMIMFVALAFWIYRPDIRKSAILSGLALGIAVCFKQIALTDMVALSIWMLASSTTIKEGVIHIGYLLIGFFLTSILVVFPVFLSGATFAQYYDSVWQSLITSRFSDTHFSGYFMQEWGRWLPLFTCSLLLIILRQGRLLFVWLMMDIAGVCASGNYFPHQFRQLIPTMALCAGCGLSAFTNARKPMLCFGVSFVVIAASVWVGSLYPILPQPKKIVEAWAEMGSWIKNNTTTNDFVYAYEGASAFHTYAMRRSSSKYYNTWFTEGKESVILADLNRNTPKFIIVGRKEPEWLADYIRINKYQAVSRLSQYRLFAKHITNMRYPGILINIPRLSSRPHPRQEQGGTAAQDRWQ